MVSLAAITAFAGIGALEVEELERKIENHKLSFREFMHAGSPCYIGSLLDRLDQETLVIDGVSLQSYYAD